MDSIRKLHKELLRVWWFFQHVARKRGSLSASVLLARDSHSIRSINSLALCLMNLKVHRHTKSIKVSVLILERVWWGFFCGGDSYCSNCERFGKNLKSTMFMVKYYNCTISLSFFSSNVFLGRQICQLVKDMSSLLKVLKKMAAKSGLLRASSY